MSAGGKGANQAVAARRLGAEVRFITLLGSDPMGDRLFETLMSAGLPATDVLRTADAATGVALVAVDPEGRNQIAVAPGANHHLTLDLVASRADALAWADVVLLQLETPIEIVAWALREGRRLGRITVLNPAPARVLPLPAGLLPLVDYLTPNESEAGLLTGCELRGVADVAAAGRALLAAGVGTAVVTVGDAGVVAVTGAGSTHVPAFDIAAVDTVGAGDAFNGAFATLLASGSAVEDALLIGNAAGALACTRRGAIDALPSRAEVEALLDRAGRPPEGVW